MNINKQKFLDILKAMCGPKDPLEAKFSVGGVFTFQCFDKDGKLKWEDTAKNAATVLGLNSVLDVSFHAATQIATWYIGLITGTGTLAEADTLASHAGWTEGTDYTGTRKEWTEGAASAKVMTNSATVDFAITGTMTVKGAFLCSVTSGTSGVLFCTALFTGGDQAVKSGDTLKVTYTLTASTT
jgi:hypothetical protein